MGAFPACAAGVLKNYTANEVHEGDAFITNHPYLGGSPHAPDMAVLTPIFYHREWVGFAANLAHKSDIGGVKVGLTNGAEVGRAYDQVLAAARTASPAATIHGVSIQRMASPGVEVIIGMTKDIQFGPVLMFGLGGVMVEVLKDVAFRIVPLTRRDARQMVREIKGFPILEGYRGQRGVDIPRLEQALLDLSAFLEKHDEVKELDLNPIFAYQDGILAVDARVILEEPAPVAGRG